VAVAVDPKAKPVVCPPPSAPNAAAKPSAAEQFPFPGEAAAPEAPKPGAGKAGVGKVADQFPYPGETSASPDAVPEGNTPRYVPDGASSGDSSSSSSGNPAAADDLDKARDKAAADDAAKPSGRRPLHKVSALSPDERVTEDLDVAKFYSGRGNFQAAYLRSKDATKIMPEDAESHFALAQAAEKLQKKDEAAAEYALYLKLDPAGDKTAAAKRALALLK
jgi:hypothetical protein